MAAIALPHGSSCPVAGVYFFHSCAMIKDFLFHFTYQKNHHHHQQQQQHQKKKKKKRGRPFSLPLFLNVVVDFVFPVESLTLSNWLINLDFSSFIAAAAAASVVLLQIVTLFFFLLHSF